MFWESEFTTPTIDMVKVVCPVCKEKTFFVPSVSQGANYCSPECFKKRALEEGDASQETPSLGEQPR